jgi:hypothetical protein
MVLTLLSGNCPLRNFTLCVQFLLTASLLLRAGKVLLQTVPAPGAIQMVAVPFSLSKTIQVALGALNAPCRIRDIQELRLQSVKYGICCQMNDISATYKEFRPFHSIFFRKTCLCSQRRLPQIFLASIQKIGLAIAFETTMRGVFEDVYRGKSSFS